MDNLKEHRENLLSLLNEMGSDEDTLVAVRNMDDEEMLDTFHRLKSAVFDATTREEGKTDRGWTIVHAEDGVEVGADDRDLKIRSALRRMKNRDMI